MIRRWGRKWICAPLEYGWKKNDSRHQKVSLIHFSGNNSTYDLTEATINLDTKLHAAFGKREVFEVFITGNGNAITGLTLIDVGDTAPIQEL